MTLIVPPYFGFSATGMGEAVGGEVVTGDGAALGAGAGAGAGVGAGAVAAFGPQEVAARTVAIRRLTVRRKILVFMSPSLSFLYPTFYLLNPPVVPP